MVFKCEIASECRGAKLMEVKKRTLTNKKGRGRYTCTRVAFRMSASDITAMFKTQWAGNCRGESCTGGVFQSTKALAGEVAGDQFCGPLSCQFSRDAAVYDQKMYQYYHDYIRV